jgi:hypothetical protein
MPTFVVVPQWQGSSNARAMRLVDGAEAIRATSRNTRSRLPAPAQATTGTPCSRRRPSTFSRSTRHSRVASGVHWLRRGGAAPLGTPNDTDDDSSSVIVCAGGTFDVNGLGGWWNYPVRLDGGTLRCAMATEDAPTNTFR